MNRHGLNFLNSNYGIVRRVSKNRETITIGRPRGGTFKAKNAGFEIGDEVAFVLDPTSRKVIRIIPKDVADAKIAISQDPALQQAISDNEIPESLLDIQAFEDNSEMLFDNNDEFITEEFCHDNTPNDQRYQGLTPEGTFDFGCGEDREDVIEPGDFHGYGPEDGDPLRIED